MTNLLSELIPLIISDRMTSLALALVNRHYNDTVTPILYKKVTLKGIGAIKAFSDTMVSGRPKLRQYPMLLHIAHWPMWGGVNPDDLIPPVRRILMHVPNLIDLSLVMVGQMTQYLIEDPRYPFKLRRLLMSPIKDARFVEFLRTQPEIESVDFWGVPDDDSSCAETAPLQPDILPKLRSIISGQTLISFLVPLRPVTKVTIYRPHWSFEIHEKVAQSLVPLESLSECILFADQPWESGIVSRCLPSLKFCWESLREYSLVLAYNWQRPSVLPFLKESDAPSHGLDNIRNRLSTFSALRKFTLAFFDNKSHDLTPEFCETVPELSRFDVWQESCPTLEEVTLFDITLKKA